MILKVLVLSNIIEMTKNTRTWFKRLGEGLGERGWCQTLSDLKMLTKRIFKMQLWLDLWLAFSWCSDTFTEQMTDFCRITNLFPYITNSTMRRVNPQCYIFLCQFDIFMKLTVYLSNLFYAFKNEEDLFSIDWRINYWNESSVTWCQ